MKNPASWLESHKTVAFVGGATAFSLLGDQVLYAVLPVYYESLGITPIQVGILLSANRWIRLATNELAHRVTRPGQEQRLFLAALTLGVISTCAYAFASYFSVLLTARLAWGLAWSFIRHIGVQSVMAGVSATQVGHTMGAYNGFSRAGSVVGLLGGSMLVDVFGFSAGVLMLAVVSLLSLPLASRGVRATSGAPPASASRASELPPSLLVLGFTLGVVGPGFVMGTLGANLTSYISATGTLTAATLTGLLLGTRYIMDVALAPLLGSATDRFGVRTASTGYLLAGGLGLLLAALQPALGLFVLGILVFFVCGTGLQAGVAGTASHHGSAAYARYVTASDLGSATGPLVGWLVVAWLDNAAWSLALGGLSYLAAIIAASRLAGSAGPASR